MWIHFASLVQLDPSVLNKCSKIYCFSDTIFWYGMHHIQCIHFSLPTVPIHDLSWQCEKNILSARKLSHISVRWLYLLWTWFQHWIGTRYTNKMQMYLNARQGNKFHFDNWFKGFYWTFLQFHTWAEGPAHRWLTIRILLALILCVNLAMVPHFRLVTGLLTCNGWWWYIE